MVTYRGTGTGATTSFPISFRSDIFIFPVDIYFILFSGYIYILSNQTLVDILYWPVCALYEYVLICVFNTSHKLHKY